MRWASTRNAAVIGLAGVGMALGPFGCGHTLERDVAAGLRAFKQGRPVEARTRFERALLHRPGAPENARIYEYLGHACWRLGDVEAAVNAFQEGRRLEPQNWRLSYNLGVIYARAGDLVRAATLFQEAALNAPEAAKPLEYLGHLHLTERRWTEARRTLLEALTRAPRSASVMTRLATAELHTHGPDVAIRRLMLALEVQPDYPPALFQLFAIHAGWLKRQTEAAAYARRFLAVASPDIDASILATVRGYLAAATAAGGSVAAAAEALPADWLAEARRLVDQGQVQAAVQLCLRAAEAARAAGRAEERERALAAATELAFDVPAGHAALGRLRYEQGRIDAALHSLKQAVVLGDDSDETLLLLAEVAERAGEPDAALVALRRAIQKPTVGADAQWRLAVFYDATLQSATDAVREYRAFITRFPNDARVVRARERIRVLSRGTGPEPTAAAASPRATPTADTGAATLARSTPAVPAPETARAQGEPAPLRPDELQLPSFPARPPPAPEPARPARQIPWRRPAVRNPVAAAQAYNRAAEYYRQGDRDRALFFFIRAAENDDSLAEAFLGMGAVYMETGDAELAQEAYRLAVERRPSDGTAWYNLALAHMALNQREAALDAAARALRAQPDLAAAYYLIGTLLASDPARRAEARTHFQRFLALAPRDPKAEATRRWLDQNRD